MWFHHCIISATFYVIELLNSSRMLSFSITFTLETSCEFFKFSNQNWILESTCSCVRWHKRYDWILYMWDFIRLPGWQKQRNPSSWSTHIPCTHGDDSHLLYGENEMTISEIELVMRIKLDKIKLQGMQTVLILLLNFKI